ncbi:hypothetical protein [Evansella halocellulosilytica]|uniref:hypothetical protein n=1 Tax=Evansella halocellulosilytica TaxID=2011013 RepID=UPI000BB83BA5|nr:hypothetical protein [Evansella halocellulosilytica]
MGQSLKERRGYKKFRAMVLFQISEMAKHLFDETHLKDELVRSDEKIAKNNQGQMKTAFKVTEREALIREIKRYR